MLHMRAELVEGHSLNPLGRPLSVADNPTRNMPALRMETVIPPGQQGLSAGVLDEEIDIHQGRHPADKLKQLFREPFRGVIYFGLERGDQIGSIHVRSSPLFLRIAKSISLPCFSLMILTTSSE